MTILHLRNSDFFGSPERLILGQVEHLPNITSIVGSFVRSDGDSDFLDQCKSRNIPTVALTESFTGDWRVIGQLREAVIDHKIDLVVSHDYKANFFAYYALKKTPARHIAYFHGVTSEDAKVRLYNFIDSIILKRIPRIITVSSQTKQRLINMGITPDSICVVANAVDKDMIAEPAPAPANDTPVRIVAAGRFSHEKGFDLLLEAIARIPDSVPPYKVFLYGHGPEEDSLKNQAKRLALTDRVEFCGFTDSLPSVFDTMDFLIMSSRSEGMPVVILEAWARGLGVLATDVGGVSELIDGRESGVLIKPEDIDDLAEKIRWGIEHRSEVRAFGRFGQELVQQKYTYAAQANELAHIYRQ